MKKVLTITAGLALAGVLTACGDANNDEADNNNSEEAVAEKVDNSDNEKEEEEKIKVNLKDERFDIVDDANGFAEVGIYAELENESDKPAFISDVEVTLYDEDDKILSTWESQDTMVDEEDDRIISPTIAQPEESSYLALNIDYEEKYDDLDYMEIDYEAKEADSDDFVELEYDEDKINYMYEEAYYDEDFETIKDSFYPGTITMTTKLENTSDQPVDYRIGIGVYDEDDKFLGSFINEYYIDESYLIDENDTETVEIDSSGLPIKEDEIDHYEIEVIGLTANAEGFNDDVVEDEEEDFNNNNDKNFNEEVEEEDSEGLTVENIKEGMGEDTTIHDLYVEDLRRLSDDDFRELMNDEEVKTFDKGEQVYAETAGEDIFKGFGTSEVDDDELNLTVEDGETVEIEGEEMEPTPFIEELKEKYGDNVTMDELTDEERNQLDMYESTYLMELEEQR